MKFSIALVFMLLSSPLLSGAFTLVRDGKPQAAFVLPPETSAALGKHIAFFNTELSRCAQTVLPVANAPIEGKNHIIFDLKRKAPAERDAFFIDFPNARTMRISGSETSVRWAFNHILEQKVGIRWLFPPLKGFYGPEINHYPEKKNIELETVNFSDCPAVNLARACDWRIMRFSENWNGTNALSRVHTVTVDVFPTHKYAANDSWPLNILPIINGKKIILPKMKMPPPENIRHAIRPYKSDWQPCWSHPDTAVIAIENILETLRRYPDKAVINLDVNDNGGYCECKECRRAVDGKLTPQGYRDYSGLYWKWVDTVVREVVRKHPDLLFSALAYREVLSPPPFQLHPNILPRICIELSVRDEPEVQAKNIQLIADWTEKAYRLDLYDYMHGLDFFLIPRIYFHSHSRILAEMVRKYKLCSAYFESCGVLPFQGPQQQLMLKLLWNPELDVEDFLKDWCEHAVGKKSAPYLRKYYQQWEDYWTGDDIRKTAWYGSVRNVYMQLGERNTHTYALKKGDMAKFRKLMEQVTANTETPEQKKRADILMKLFELSENACTAAFSEIIPPDGILKTSEQALDLLEMVPTAMTACRKYMCNPFVKIQHDEGNSLFPASVSSVGKVLPFLKDKRVRQKLEKLSGNDTLPFTLRAQIKIWLGAKVRNLIENGSFEQEKPLLQSFWGNYHGERDTQYASDGRYSFRTHNGFYRFRRKIKSQKLYLFLCDVFTAKGSGEGRLRFRLGPSCGVTPLKWFSLKNIILTAGSWNTYSLLVYGQDSGGKAVDNLEIQLWIQKFEQEEAVWFDNIRLYCLDEIQ